MNYTELTAAITSYIEGTGVTSFSADDLATMVRNAEQRIYNAIQLPAARFNSEGAMTASNRYLTVPDGFLSVLSMSVRDPDTDEVTFLLDKDVTFIRESYPSPSTTGTPRYYALMDASTLILGPTPDANYVTFLEFNAYPTSIVTAGNTWLGDNFEPALLYASLLEAASFVKESQDVIATYQSRYAEAMILLKQYGDTKVRIDFYRTPQPQNKP